MPNNSKKYDIDAIYAQYLFEVKLNEARMSLVQRIETKRAFMGGVGALLKVLFDLADGPEEGQADALLNVDEQLEQYWKTETKRQGIGRKL